MQVIKNNRTLLVVDVGSNTTKCLLADKTATGIILPILEKSVANRICKDGGLADDSAQKTSRCIKEFVKLAESLKKPFELRCVGTSALRSAQNGKFIADEIYRLCNAKIKIISGETEALLSFMGAMSDTSLPHTDGDVLFMDIGGGSLELASGKQDICSANLLKRCSFPLGAVRLEERFSLSDSYKTSAAEKISACEDFCLKTLLSWTIPNKINFLIGSGGALSAVRVISAKMNGLQVDNCLNAIDIAFINTLLKDMISMPLQERAKTYKIDVNRADILPAALVCIMSLMKYCGKSKIYHTFRSLRYGVAMIEDFSCI